MQTNTDKISLPREAACGSCRFYSHPGRESGFCLFHPPCAVTDQGYVDDGTRARTWAKYICCHWAVTPEVNP